jgi:hypothetical protein
LKPLQTHPPHASPALLLVASRRRFAATPALLIAHNKLKPGYPHTPQPTLIVRLRLV